MTAAQREQSFGSVRQLPAFSPEAVGRGAYRRRLQNDGLDRPSQLIQVLEPRLLADSVRDADLSELLDLAFETKLKLEGKAAAFPYMVQAQMFRGGWLGSMLENPSKSRPRLQRVTSVYKPRCDEFFLKSSYSWLSLPRKQRVIPSDIMVYFLGLQGRIAEAVQFAQAMVKSVQDDTRTLQLKVPSWAGKLAAAAPAP